MQIPQGQVTKPPPDPVTHHGGAHFPAHDETDPGRLTAILPHQQMPGKQRAPGPAAVADRRGELPLAAHPRDRRQHRGSPSRSWWHHHAARRAALLRR